MNYSLAFLPSKYIVNKYDRSQDPNYIAPEERLECGFSIDDDHGIRWCNHALDSLSRVSDSTRKLYQATVVNLLDHLL